MYKPATKVNINSLTVAHWSITISGRKKSSGTNSVWYEKKQFLTSGTTILFRANVAPENYIKKTCKWESCRD